MTARKATELTDAQRRAVLASDPATGELSAAPAVCAALRARGLAVEYGRARRHYLTGAGRALRDRLRDRPAGEPEAPPQGFGAPPPSASLPAPAASGPGGGFEAATGDGPAPDGEPARRAAAAARAWAGVLEIRRVTGTAAADGTGVPAPWERTRMVRAVSLALESAGVLPSAVDGKGRRTRAGYRVSPSGEPGSVRVEWPGPSVQEARREAGERLRSCARLLEERGWEALLYRGPRHTPFLLVAPRRR